MTDEEEAGSKEKPQCGCGLHTKAVPHLWSVYVLEVEGAPGEVYVGSSWHTPQVRRQQHVDGPKKGKVFKKPGHMVGPLRPDLLPALEPLTTGGVARAAEVYVARILESKKYVVHGDH